MRAIFGTQFSFQIQRRDLEFNEAEPLAQSQYKVYKGLWMVTWFAFLSFGWLVVVRLCLLVSLLLYACLFAYWETLLICPLYRLLTQPKQQLTISFLFAGITGCY